MSVSPSLSLLLSFLCSCLVITWPLWQIINRGTERDAHTQTHTHKHTRGRDGCPPQKSINKIDSHLCLLAAPQQAERQTDEWMDGRMDSVFVRDVRGGGWGGVGDGGGWSGVWVVFTWKGHPHIIPGDVLFTAINWPQWKIPEMTREQQTEELRETGRESRAHTEREREREREQRKASQTLCVI